MLIFKKGSSGPLFNHCNYFEIHERMSFIILSIWMSHCHDGKINLKNTSYFLFFILYLTVFI